jgi:DNA-binding transcriptional ArsR family regulator
MVISPDLFSLLCCHKYSAMEEYTKMNFVAARDAAVILRSINHKLRKRILTLLEENKRLNVTDIYVKLRLEQAVASQHLAALRWANIVTIERDGRQKYYSLNHGRIEKVVTLLNKLELVSANSQ